RAVLALDAGATLTFPGEAGVSEADYRQDAMYKLSAGTIGLHWGIPLPRGTQFVLPVGAAVYDAKGTPRGVAVLEVSLDRLLARPDGAKLDYVQTKMLVTRAGKVMAEDNSAAGRAPLATAVLDAMAMGKSGSLETASDGHKWLTTFYPLASLDWY